MKKRKAAAILYAILAALFYAVNMPFSKLLLNHVPSTIMGYILLALLLGFVAYGLSIFFYIRAQKDLGAAKTSAYYAIAPFAGAFLSFVILREALSAQYLVALLFMLAGSVVATVDTLLLHHQHMHTHVITHVHNGVVHTHVITHSHPHDHLLNEEKHHHMHTGEQLQHSHSV